MVKLDVPFYPNTPDDTHCFQAALKSILKYFLPDREFTWEGLDKLSAKKEGLWTWPMSALLNLKKMGFDVVNMEDWDYKAFTQKGGEYLVEKYGKEIAEKQIKNSDTAQERKFAKEFVKVFGEQKSLPKVEDIKRLLKRGYLVICNLNSLTLAGKRGYVGHFVVVIGFGDSNLYLHDPGLPPKENRKVSNKRFMKAWAYPNGSVKNLTAFKYAR